jgi:hypothetical protein
MHEYLPFAITLVVILAGILFNRADLGSLRLELNGRLDKLDQRIDKMEQRIDQRLLVIEGDLRAFYQITGELKGRIDTLEKRH